MSIKEALSKEIIINKDSDYAIENVICPHCNGFFAVDWTYLDQVDDVVSCPMCLGRVRFVLEDEND